MGSKVYFTDMRALPGTNLPDKLKKLIKKAGIGEIDFNKKMTAIKIHFGEPGNLSGKAPCPHSVHPWLPRSAGNSP